MPNHDRLSTDRDWIEKLRELASRRVEASGLRVVARDVGMSASGLDKFLSGGAPYAATRRKLLSWAKRQPGGPVIELPGSEAEGILHDLLAPLPPAERDRAVERVAEIIRDVYDQHKVPAPEWLEDVLAKSRTSSGQRLDQDAQR